MLANPSIHAPLLHTNRWRLPLSCNLHRSLRPKKAPRSSSSLLFSSKSCSFGVRALAESQASEINPSSVEAPPGVAQPFSVKIPVGDRHVSCGVICISMFFLRFGWISGVVEFWLLIY